MPQESKAGVERDGRPVSGPLVDLERRRISALAALALLGGATITITSCGSGTPQAPSPPAGGCPPDAACGEVAGDPLHNAMITGAQLAAGNALVLDISGSAAHSHTVELSAQDIVAIREKRRVEKFSSENANHSHLVTFNSIVR